MFSIKAFTVATLSLVFLLFLNGCQKFDEETSTHAFSMDSAINKAAEKFLDNDNYHSVSIAIYDNANAYIRHYGELTIGQDNAPNNTTLYELGSVSKLFTGTLAAKAVAENKLSLDTDVRDFLDGKGGDLTYGNLSYRGQAIIVRHLLTHTSGFPNIIPGLDNKSIFFKELSEIRISDDPGKKFSYSNTAPELMAFILESVYKKSYNILLDELFESWGMSNTMFGLNDEGRARLTQGYSENAKLMPNLDSSLWGGAVGLHSTSSDLMMFIKSQLERPSKIILESRKELFSVSKKMGVGYFWQIDKREGELSYRHHGGIYGMQNWIMIYPEHKVGISVITNTSFNGVGDRLEKLSDTLLADAIRLRN